MTFICEERTKCFGVGLMLLFLSCQFTPVELRGINGGFSCGVCTVMFGMADQLAQIHNETLLTASLWLCNILPSSASTHCAKTIRKLESLLIDPELLKFFTPDVICYAIDSCYVDPGEKYCHLFPKPLSGFHPAVKKFKLHVAKSSNVPVLKKRLKKMGIDFCLLPGIQELCALVDKSWTKMEPVVDFDGDSFSLLASARGSNWRGRDCRDFDATSYPGRQSLDTDADYNCNGVWGSNPKTGRSYEEELCGTSRGRGIIYLGDSVGAHFHFPEAWMNPKLITLDVMHNYTIHILDELDWPQLGFATGFTNTTEPTLINGPTDSIYLKLRARNRCNHRDYQNLSRNGVSSYALVDYVRNVARNQTTDKPALLIYGVVGNDVCNPYKDTLSNMTTTQHFRKNVLAVLDNLDTILPNGSHVILIGLVDGETIYPTMADRFHPLGEMHQDIRYRDVYDWFTCMSIGPCNGWMTSNSTLRKLTTQRALKLNDVLYDVSIKETFKSFKVGYLRNPLQQVFYEWSQLGKPVWQLIDPIDSLHPSQLGQPLIANALWKAILEKFPEALGDENPYNTQIQDLFGDQGGH